MFSILAVSTLWPCKPVKQKIYEKRYDLVWIGLIHLTTERGKTEILAYPYEKFREEGTLICSFLPGKLLGVLTYFGQ